MATYEDVLDDVTLQASEIVARDNTDNIVVDLYNCICEKCENGQLINELNGIERIFYLCQTFEYEMKNEGIDCYYCHDCGNFANETVEALVEIGAHDTALILDKGNSIFKNGIVPEDLEARLEEIDLLDLNEKLWLFDELDREFSCRNDNLEQLCLNYVLNHTEAFM